MNFWIYINKKISIFLDNLSKGDAVIDFFNRPLPHRTSHYLHLLLTALFLSAGIFLTWHLGMLGPSKPAIMPGEIDLSGKWKIKYEDNGEFAKIKTEESSWCEIGVPDPKLGDPQIKENCPSEIYPIEKMQNSTYWYRKEILIPQGYQWKDPSLFLGAIKHKSWIYWDGELIGMSNLKEGTGMSSVILDPSLVKPGKHSLAIRVKTEKSKYPGIFHAYSRKVALGDLSGIAPQHQSIINARYILPGLNLFVQTCGLLLTLLILCLGRGSGTEFFWLAIYFSTTAASSALNAFAVNDPTNRSLIWGLLGISGLGVFGYSLKLHPLFHSLQFIFSRALGLLFIFSSLGIFLNAKYELFSAKSLTIFYTSLAILPLLAITLSLLNSLYSSRKIGAAKKMEASALLSISILLLSHLINAAPFLFFSSQPIITSNPILKSLLSVFLVVSMVYQFTKQERTLAFYGRFIRPGLKTLLQEAHKEKKFGDQKFFRPRQIAIMKVDIVGHTETTFQMPYGMKRLFQDTWFSLIDQVVADRIFLDKNVGDGSVYCFSEHHKDGACGSALIAAQLLREAVPKFDQIYKERLEALLEITPELHAPAKAFFRAYEERTGLSFFARKTGIRLGLVYGFVDEGLWGHASQSHYDVQGDLVSLAARIEAKAQTNEILLDKNFYKKLENELGPTKKIKAQKRTETLKGMGATELYSFEEILLAFKKAG